LNSSNATLKLIAPMTEPRQQPTQAASVRPRWLALGVLAFVIGVSIDGF